MDLHGPGERWTAIQVVMLPRDANPVPTVLPGFGPSPLFATIFGGVILSYIDQAGAIAARREVSRRGGHRTAIFVTAAIKTVEFRKPVLVGDVVRFETTVTRIGRTSVTVQVDVIAERNGEPVAVTSAEGVFVGLDPSTPDRRPVPLLPDAAAAGFP